jgi:hypothetical protein
MARKKKLAAERRRRKTYDDIIEAIFASKFKPGCSSIEFEREDIIRFCRSLKIPIPKNLGDVVYSYRYRTDLPASIRETAGKTQEWVIKGSGRGRYRFILRPYRPIVPVANLTVTKVPDSTPGVVAKYALNDEQALLARIRYNRLVDVFTGVACYSLQNHLRTTVPELGQVETDELYVGLDKKGSHYVFPVQAKGGKDRLSGIQIEQDMAVCSEKFPALICRPLGAQFLDESTIALFEFEQDENGISICSERHYRLVPPDEVTDTDLSAYKTRID